MSYNYSKWIYSIEDYQVQCQEWLETLNEWKNKQIHVAILIFWKMCFLSVFHQALYFIW